MYIHTCLFTQKLLPLLNLLLTMVQSHYFQLLILKQCFVVAIMVVIVVVVVMLVLVMVVFTCKRESREVIHYELAIPRDEEGVEVSTGYCWKNCCFICGCEV